MEKLVIPVQPEVKARLRCFHLDPDGSTRIEKTVVELLQKNTELQAILDVFKEPKCSSCGVGVDRPKCMFELGNECPRHETRNQWKANTFRMTHLITSGDMKAAYLLALQITKGEDE
jgi:hypothetical protein